jgi:hypothetical protein
MLYNLRMAHIISFVRELLLSFERRKKSKIKPASLSTTIFQWTDARTPDTQ